MKLGDEQIMLYLSLILTTILNCLIWNVSIGLLDTEELSCLLHKVWTFETKTVSLLSKS